MSIEWVRAAVRVGINETSQHSQRVKKVQSQLLIIENRINWRGETKGAGREAGNDGIKWIMRSLDWDIARAACRL